VKEITRLTPGTHLADRQPTALPEAITRLDRVHVLAVVLALGLTAFLAIEPTQDWLLLLLAGLAALGTDAVVRTHPKAHFHKLDDTVLFLLVPVMMTLGGGLFLEDVVGGHWTIAIGLLSVIPYWAVLRAEYESVDRAAETYQSTRLVLNVATYVVAFLFFATIYDFDLGLLASAFASGTIAVLLGIEVLREEAMDNFKTATHALAIGVLLAQSAWVTHFLPLDGSSAAVFLLLAFYLTTGIMHNYLAGRLDARTGAEFAGVAAAGLVIVTLSQAFG
jgi:hypothetical protein